VVVSDQRRETRQGGLTENRKSRRHDAASGEPGETELGDSGKGWWDGVGVVVVVVVVVRPGRKCETRGGGWGQKPETEPFVARFRARRA
jgi:hypothetical protein